MVDEKAELEGKPGSHPVGTGAGAAAGTAGEKVNPQPKVEPPVPESPESSDPGPEFHVGI